MRFLIALVLLAGCEKKQEASSEQPPGATPRTLPDACNDYRRAIEGLAKCEKMPKQSVDALRQAFDAMSRSWGDNLSMSVEARTSLATACKQGADALKQATATMCGAEPVEAPPDLPRECLDYQRVTAAVTRCDKLSADVRSALQLAFDQLSRRWAGDQSQPPATRQALGDSCKAATDTVRDIAGKDCKLDTL